MLEPAAALAKPRLRVVLCAPRGFCAGVVRAIDIVERALEIYGAPVYVRHEIVHNKFVVESLKAKGVVFVKELSEARPGSQPVIFSAHGVASAVPEEAKARSLFTIDATCPLVTKVHREAQAHFKRGRQIVLIGHLGHPEVIGTTGQLPPGAVAVVASTEDVDRLPADDERPGRLCNSDNAISRRHARHRGGPDAPLSRYPRATDGAISATPPPTVRGGQDRRTASRGDHCGGRSQFFEFSAAARCRRTRGMRCATGRRRARDRLEDAGEGELDRRHRRRLGA